MPSSLPAEATAFLASAQVLPFGIATTDPHGNITFANAAYARLAGCTPDELLGQMAGEFDWEALAQATPSPEPFRDQAVCRRQTDKAYTVEYSITALRGPAGGFWLLDSEENCHRTQPTGRYALSSRGQSLRPDREYPRSGLVGGS